MCTLCMDEARVPDGDLSGQELTSILYTLGTISRLALRGQGLRAGVQG